MNKENQEPKKVNTEEENSDNSRSPGTDRSPNSSDTSDNSDNSRSPGTDRDIGSSRSTSVKLDDSPGTDRNPGSS
ncbi:MAG: hypothetical protein WBF90_24165 [Rivularia sp. (in: cyanobacteria)]